VQYDEYLNEFDPDKKEKLHNDVNFMSDKLYENQTSISTWSDRCHSCRNRGDEEGKSRGC
jgi:hypothetical protein